MKLDNNIAIDLDSSGHYLAGDVVSGTLVLKPTQSLQLDRLAMRLTGQVCCAWVNSTSDIYYETKDELLHDIIELTSYLSQISDGQLLPEGEHRIPFKFKLPAVLPSSIFNDLYGWVSYSCAAVIQLSTASCLPIFSSANRNLVFEKAIEVYSLLSLNSAPHYLEPVRMADHVRVTRCCRRQGVITACLSLQRLAFAPGQSVEAHLWVENGTRDKLRYLASLSLYQRLDFKAQNRYRHDVHLYDQKDALLQLCEMAATVRVGARTEPADINISLQLPARLPPTTTIPDAMIAISYFLKLEMAKFELILPLVLVSRAK